MARVALITGAAGARERAIAEELERSGWEVRRSAFDGTALPDLVEAARGSEVVFHVGVRTPRSEPASRRADAEAAAAYAAGNAARVVGARRFVLVSTASVYGR